MAKLVGNGCVWFFRHMGSIFVLYDFCIMLISPWSFGGLLVCTGRDRIGDDSPIAWAGVSCSVVEVMCWIFNLCYDTNGVIVNDCF